MEAESTKENQPSAVADIPANVSLADVLAELRGVRSEVAAVNGRLEKIRRVMFYIPEVAEGVKASQAKKAQAEKTDAQAENNHA